MSTVKFQRIYNYTPAQSLWHGPIPKFHWGVLLQPFIEESQLKTIEGDLSSEEIIDLVRSAVLVTEETFVEIGNDPISLEDQDLREDTNPTIIVEPRNKPPQSIFLSLGENTETNCSAYFCHDDESAELIQAAFALKKAVLLLL